MLPLNLKEYKGLIINPSSALQANSYIIATPPDEVIFAILEQGKISVIIKVREAPPYIADHYCFDIEPNNKGDSGLMAYIKKSELDLMLDAYKKGTLLNEVSRAKYQEKMTSVLNVRLEKESMAIEAEKLEAALLFSIGDNPQISEVSCKNEGVGKGYTISFYVNFTFNPTDDLDKIIEAQRIQKLDLLENIKKIFMRFIENVEDPVFGEYGKTIQARITSADVEKILQGFIEAKQATETSLIFSNPRSRLAPNTKYGPMLSEEEKSASEDFKLMSALKQRIPIFDVICIGKREEGCTILLFATSGSGDSDFVDCDDNLLNEAKAFFRPFTENLVFNMGSMEHPEFELINQKAIQVQITRADREKIVQGLIEAEGTQEQKRSYSSPTT